MQNGAAGYSALEQRPDIDAGEYLQINQSNEQKLRHNTGAMCHEECFFATNAMSALAYCSKCISADHRLTPMTQIDKFPPSDRHLPYFCHTCSAIHRTLPLRSLDDCSVPNELFQTTSFIHKMLVSRSTSRKRILITGSNNFHMTMVQVMMNSFTKCGKKHQQR